jgi:hypothetical protein
MLFLMISNATGAPFGAPVAIPSMPMGSAPVAYGRFDRRVDAEILTSGIMADG